jgi:hyperosmotically inducible periplasmic protein
MKYLKHIGFIAMAVAALVVAGCQTSTRYSRSTGEFIDDGTITSKVKAALAKDSLTDAAHINVDTFRGNVHLSGFADDPVQKQRANDIVRSVEGVQFFKNDILVKSEIPGGTGTQYQNQPANARATSSSASAGWERGTGTRLNEPAGSSTNRNGTIQPK